MVPDVSPAAIPVIWAGSGFFEILAINDRIRKLLADQTDKVGIRQQALKDGMVPMIKDGMLKVKEGLTTPKEVLRATYTQE